MPPEPAKPNPNRKLGPALRRTDADRARAAEVTFEDILDAREAFEKHAPDGYRGLIEARPEKPKDR